MDMFGLSLPDDFPPRYNVAPTEDVPVVRAAPTGRRLDLLHWGLVPRWAQDPSIGNRMINARAETAAEKPAFRDALRRRRCLIPADGFYEWKKVEGAKRKQPYLFRMKGDRPFAFAGVWESWRREGEALESFTILTTGPNELLAGVHDRMPVIVAPADYDRWLDPARNATDVQDLLRAYPAGEMEAVRVSTRVNNAGFDDPSCAEAEEAWE
jgi:putative SOS response-associated peptidase YedK